ncbi:hypothetical protein MPLDJ20_100013 [Mesorhizobium plurifarium]|uniref:Uncharacterized protein n=1 Tax=Mesorhizobium plurifarium TaxID=69974 RepID=A0A090DDM8_MESPL|nr:hypothetical protein MPLDJ20_100013 [Mesorhizobium plurifarium]CDX38718.1 hypothetical protein MPLSOD_340014 [Mesorhizobium sp. SOD10]
MPNNKSQIFVKLALHHCLIIVELRGIVKQSTTITHGYPAPQRHYCFATVEKTDAAIGPIAEQARFPERPVSAVCAQAPLSSRG